MHATPAKASTDIYSIIKGLRIRVCGVGGQSKVGHDISAPAGAACAARHARQGVHAHLLHGVRVFLGLFTTRARLKALLAPHATPAKASTYTYSIVCGYFLAFCMTWALLTPHATSD